MLSGQKNGVILVLVILLTYFVYAYFSVAALPEIVKPKSNHETVIDSLENVVENLMKGKDSLTLIADSLRDENVAIEKRIIGREKKRNEIYNNIMDSPADSSYEFIKDYLRSR